MRIHDCRIGFSRIMIVIVWKFYENCYFFKINNRWKNNFCFVKKYLQDSPSFSFNLNNYKWMEYNRSFVHARKESKFLNRGRGDLLFRRQMFRGNLSQDYIIFKLNYRPGIPSCIHNSRRNVLWSRSVMLAATIIISVLPDRIYHTFDLETPSYLDASFRNLVKSNRWIIYALSAVSYIPFFV